MYQTVGGLVTHMLGRIPSAARACLVAGVGGFEVVDYGRAPRRQRCWLAGGAPLERRRRPSRPPPASRRNAGRIPARGAKRIAAPGS